MGWVPIGSALGHQAWTATAPGSNPSQQQQSSGGAGRLNPPSGGRVYGMGAVNADPEAARGATREEKEPLIEQVSTNYSIVFKISFHC